MCIRLPWNWISYSPSPVLPFSNIPLYKNLPQFLCLLWYYKTSVGAVCLFLPSHWAPDAFLCVFWHLHFHMDGFKCFCSCSDTIDTNHLQVISQDKKSQLIDFPWGDSNFLWLLTFSCFHPPSLFPLTDSKNTAVFKSRRRKKKNKIVCCTGMCNVK